MSESEESELKELIEENFLYLTWYPSLPKHTGYVGDLSPCTYVPAEWKTPRNMQTAGLGKLLVLPFEVLAETVLAMDLMTIFAFRFVSGYARDLINNLPEYKAIAKHAPNVFRAVLLSGPSDVTLRMLYDILTDPKCTHCSNYGCYIHLHTLQRVCYPCTAADAFLPVTMPQAKEWFDLEDHVLRGLPMTWSCPKSRAAPLDIDMDVRIPLLHFPEVFDAAIRRYGSADAAIAVYDERMRRVRDRLAMVRMQGLPHEVDEILVVGEAYRVYERHYVNHLWASGTVQAPWIDPRGNRAEDGVSCVCQKAVRTPPRGYPPPCRMFTKTMFVEHALECRRAKQVLGSVLRRRRERRIARGEEVSEDEDDDSLSG